MPLPDQTCDGFSVGVVKTPGGLWLDLGASSGFRRAQLPKIQRRLAEEGRYSRLLDDGRSLRLLLPTEEKRDARAD